MADGRDPKEGHWAPVPMQPFPHASAPMQPFPRAPAVLSHTVNALVAQHQGMQQGVQQQGVQQQGVQPDAAGTALAQTQHTPSEQGSDNEQVRVWEGKCFSGKDYGRYNFAFLFGCYQCLGQPLLCDHMLF